VAHYISLENEMQLLLQKAKNILAEKRKGRRRKYPLAAWLFSAGLKPANGLNIQLIICSKSFSYSEARRKYGQKIRIPAKYESCEENDFGWRPSYSCKALQHQRNIKYSYINGENWISIEMKGWRAIMRNGYQ